MEYWGEENIIVIRSYTLEYVLYFVTGKSSC